MSRLFTPRRLLILASLLILLGIVGLKVEEWYLAPRLTAIEAYIEGMVNTDRGDYGRAIASFDQALSLGYTPYRVHASRGHALCRSGQFEEGIAEIDRAIALAPEEPFPLREKAQALYEHGDFATAIQETNRAMERLPGQDKTRLEWLLALRAKARFRLGDFREALKDINEAIQLDGKNAHYRVVRDQIEQALPPSKAPAA